MNGRDAGIHPARKFPYGLSVFFPAYNDAPSLPSLIAKTFEVLRQHASDYEVVVVNDGSHDDTAQVLESLRVEYQPNLRVVTHEVNRGYGGALRSGFAAATRDFVFYTDGDGQYDVSELPNLMALVQDDVGLVNGFKLERNDPWHRVWIGKTYNRFARFLFGVKLADIDCDFRLIRRKVMEDIELVSTSGTICVELVRKIEMSPYQVRETGVHHFPRLHGKSQFFRLKSLFTTLYQLLRLYVQVVLMGRWRTVRKREAPPARTVSDC
ncbi:MAG: glycosyltransferase family 2 protein [Acidobacteriota bacterium]